MPVDTWCTRPVASCRCTPNVAHRSFPRTESRGPLPGARTTIALTATPTCGSCSYHRRSPGLYQAIPPCSRPPTSPANSCSSSPAHAATTPQNAPSTAPARARLRRVLLDELHEAPEQPLQLPEPTDDRLRAIARNLNENPDDNTSLAELGRTIGASARTLSRLFHDELGMTFNEWRTQLRIYHALVLLADGHDTTTSPTLGRANPSHFIAAFTELIGTTPGRHRTSL